MRQAAALWAAGLLAASAARADDRRQLFLGQVEVQNPAGLSLAKGEPLRVLLVAAPGRAQELRLLRTRWPNALPTPEGIVLQVRGYPDSTDPVRPAHWHPTFVVDYDDAAFGGVRAEAQRSLGIRPSPAELARYAERFIRTKNYQRGFDVASVVAVRREGDCTEHAVFLTALLRLFGRPARVMFGLALVQVEEEVLAFAHAWVESFDGTRWAPLDGTGISGELPVVYIPFAPLRDEGPGFGVDLLRPPNPAMVRSVRIAPLEAATASTKP